MPDTVMLKLNEPDVVSETIDGETVVVSLSTGSYYSLEGSATVVWNLIDSKHTIEQILAAIVQQFEGDHLTIETAVRDLIEQLQKEKLVVVVDTAVNEPFNETAEQPAADPVSPRLFFVTPSLQKFSDMQELLLLDPIHEADQQAGWPAAKKESVTSVEA